MYFHNRAQAGKMLAKELIHYKNQNNVVLALSPGATIVGAQIAIRTHAGLMMLLTEKTGLPGEDQVMEEALAGMDSFGNMYSPGQFEEETGDYYRFVYQQHIEKLRAANRFIGKDGEIQPEYLKHHIVIVVSDGLANGLSVDVAADYLKWLSIKRLVVAAPVASVSAVDRMHIAADEIHCLSISPNYVGTNHYYDDNTVPPVSDLMKILKTISLHWERPYSSPLANT